MSNSVDVTIRRKYVRHKKDHILVAIGRVCYKQYYPESLLKINSVCRVNGHIFKNGYSHLLFFLLNVEPMHPDNQSTKNIQSAFFSIQAKDFKADKMIKTKFIGEPGVNIFHPDHHQWQEDATIFTNSEIMNHSEWHNHMLQREII